MNREKEPGLRQRVRGLHDQGKTKQEIMTITGKSYSYVYDCLRGYVKMRTYHSEGENSEGRQKVNYLEKITALMQTEVGERIREHNRRVTG